jgi:alpha-beta hydrolase superfamily lysophospholipase
MLANRMELLPWAEAFYKAGFSTLVFDFRALGESEGLLATAGYLETQDFLGALNFVSERSDLSSLPVGVFGFSMGGSVAITGAARDKRVQAVATHGAFATLDRAIMQRCRKHFGLMARPAAWSIRGLTAFWMPVHSREFAPIAEAANIAPRPFLILHGSEDSIILPEDAHDLYAAAATEGGLHILPDSGHRRISDEHKESAFETVVSFFTKYLVPT